MSEQFGVCHSLLSDKINAGRISADGKRFLSRHDVTPLVLAAIVSYASSPYWPKGAREFMLDGQWYRIIVERLPGEPDTGGTDERE